MNIINQITNGFAIDVSNITQSYLDNISEPCVIHGVYNNIECYIATIEHYDSFSNVNTLKQILLQQNEDDSSLYNHIKSRYKKKLINSNNIIWSRWQLENADMHNYLVGSIENNADSPGDSSNNQFVTIRNWRII